MKTKLELNHSYLITRHNTNITYLTVVKETVTAYKIEYENGNTSWESKDRVKYWTIQEDLGVVMQID